MGTRNKIALIGASIMFGLVVTTSVIAAPKQFCREYAQNAAVRRSNGENIVKPAVNDRWFNP